MRRNKTRDVQIFGLIFGMMVVTSIPCSLAAGFSSDQACTDNERWQWDSRIIPQEIQTSYQSFLRGSLSPPRAFAEALSLRRVYRSNTPGVFSEYWISRAFYSAGLIHVAYQGLSTIAQREVPPEAAPILDAVFSCMNQIQKKAPGLSLNAEMIPSLVRLPKTVATRIAALKLTLDLLGGQDRAAIEQLLKYLADTGSTEYLSRGFSTALQSQHANTVQWLEKYIKNIPPALALYEVPARMILARAHFATGNFDGAIREYLLIPKESNEISKVLEELAWAYLRANKLKEAVGTTANLHSGGFKKTFAPESHFIMAITFNELCHYPEAIKAVNLFRRDYEATHAWLSQWKVDYDRKKGDLSPYDQIISHIKQKKIDVPIKVVNEWLRSPLFLSRQDHLNQLIREKDSVNQFNERAMKDGAAMAKDLLSFLKNFRPAYRKAKSQGAYGDPLPKAMLEDLELFKKR